LTAIVIHAGMPKAGSSSIQQWLERNSGELRERGFTVLTGSEAETGEIEFVPHERGPVNAGWIVNEAVGMPTAFQRRRTEALVEGLSAAAQRYGNVVVSAEAFSLPFWSLHEISLAGFQELSTRHEVRVAYYARPQHAHLEAAWRQWGFRLQTPPSNYIEERAADLAYASTLSGVHDLAPGVSLELRPFRGDMLDGGDVVRDFARRFLQVDSGEPGEPVNVGLPLEVAILLSSAPAGMFWDSAHDNARVNAIKRVLQHLDLPADDRLARSRRILRKYAFERFATENAALGWGDFVTLPGDAAELPGLEALDSLWRPRASPAELAVLFEALRGAIAT